MRSKVKAKAAPAKVQAAKVTPIKAQAAKIEAAVETGKIQIETALKAGQDQLKTVSNKMQKQMEEMVVIAKGNVEALVASGEAAKKGFETLGKAAADYTKSNVVHAQETFKTLSSVKTPKEFFEVQTNAFKASYDKFVGEFSKMSEMYMKVAGEVVEPVSNRASVVMDKMNKKAA
jgi:phasin family protein